MKTFRYRLCHTTAASFGAEVGRYQTLERARTSLSRLMRQTPSLMLGIYDATKAVYIEGECEQPSVWHPGLHPASNRHV